MTRESLTRNVTRLRDSAQDFVRRYAATRTPTVPAATVEAIVRALGEISIAEACTALDREAGTPPEAACRL